MADCPVHGPRQIIDYDVTESLVYKRSELFVMVTKYPKFACPNNPGCGIASPERPTSLVEGNRYSTSVAAVSLKPGGFFTCRFIVSKIFSPVAVGRLEDRPC